MSLNAFKCRNHHRPALRPQSLQFVIRMEGQILQHLLSWTLQSVQSQVQLSEVGRVGLQQPQLTSDKLQSHSLSREQTRQGGNDMRCVSVCVRVRGRERETTRDLWYDQPNWPQSLHFTLWSLQIIIQQLHSWISQLVVTQVQLSEVGGVKLQRWGLRTTTELWQPAALQSEITRNSHCTCGSLILYFFIWGHTPSIGRNQRLTWEPGVCSLDLQVQHRPASALDSSGSCHSAWAPWGR